MIRCRHVGTLLLLTLMLLQQALAAVVSDPLLSWRAGSTKDSIISFVTAVTD